VEKGAILSTLPPPPPPFQRKHGTALTSCAVTASFVRT
jgi:hypothetical protein